MQKTTDRIRLNLGCGERCLPGYLNVDKFGKPDVLFDLETFPWPWDDGSVQEIMLSHVLEHLGQTTEIYFSIIKELYRICMPGAYIYIVAPHPRHDSFINDPTHVRAVTPDGLQLFSKAKNREWLEKGLANSPLGLDLDVDFEIVTVKVILDSVWEKKRITGQLTEDQIDEAINKYNNVAENIQIVLRAIK